MSRRNATTLAIPLFLLATTGVGALIPSHPVLALGLVAMVPTFLVLSRAVSSLEPVVVWTCVFILVQPLSTFAIQTPLGTITVDNVILLALAATRIPHWSAQERTAKVITGLLLGWVATFPLRIVYLEPVHAFRTTITAVSFLLIFAVGRTLPRDWRSLKAIAWSAFAAEAVFGVAAWLAATGRIPMPIVEGVVGQREMFGIISPYPRNYGLNVAIDSIALLSAIAVPMLAYLALAPAMRARDRIAGLLGLAAMAYWDIYLFQARGMVLQIILSVLGVVVLTRPVMRLIAIPASVLIGINELSSVLSVDTVSSTLRLANYSEVWNIVTSNPKSLLLGQDENLVFRVAAERVGWVKAITGVDNAIHNAFLSALVGGGVIAFICLAGAYLIGLRKAWTDWTADRDSPTTYLLVALFVCIVELMVEPARAQVVGNWLILGIVARGTVRHKLTTPRLQGLVRPASGRWPSEASQLSQTQMPPTDKATDAVVR